jgi:hypothetical protein
VIFERAAILVALLLACSSVARAGGAITVPVRIPVAEKLDMRGVRRVLVASFIQSEHPAISLRDEVVNTLRRELRKNTALEIVDAVPPELPAQNLNILLKNASFWRSIAERYGADLVISGTMYFFRGSTGELIYEDYFAEDSIQEGNAADHLTVFYALTQRLQPDILGIVSPRQRQEQRYLFTE